MNPGHSSALKRRNFIVGSAALSAGLLMARSSGAAATATDPKAGPSLLLPAFLSCPTGSSIRISSLNDRVAAEIVTEVRKLGEQNWERRKSPQKLAPYEVLHWHEANLLPASRYEYRLLAKFESETTFRTVASGRFRTQLREPSSYSVLLMTDPHTGYFAPGSPPVATLDAVVKNAAETEADFVLDLGDNVAWAGSREYPQTNTDGAFTAYARYRKQLGPLSSKCPHFAVIGNWVGENGKFPQKSIDLASSVRRALLPGPNDTTYPEGGSPREDYYAFSWGGALYVILNIQTYSKPSDAAKLPSLMSDVNQITEWTLGEKQMNWFEKTLSNATERFRFVCIHHPAGGNAGDSLNTLYGRGGARAWNTGEQIRIHALMKKHKVQIFFYGHDHVFVDDVVDGIHYTLPGSCGAPWKFTRAETGYERFWPDSGHARLDVTPEKATVTFINIEGKILHSFSVPPV